MDGDRVSETVMLPEFDIEVEVDMVTLESDWMTNLHCLTDVVTDGLLVPLFVELRESEAETEAVCKMELERETLVEAVIVAEILIDSVTDDDELLVAVVDTVLLGLGVALGMSSSQIKRADSVSRLSTRAPSWIMQAC
jgi:hypothetical protein